MSQKSQVKIWEAPCVIPTNKVYPPEKSPLFIEKRAYQGNTGKFYPLAGLSGLQNIEYSIYEAAMIDGASPLQSFFKITVPLLKPTILMTTIISTNGTLQLFDESLNLTNGGPGRSTMTMSHYIYNTSFVNSPNFGYASAMSILILFMVAILAVIQMKVGDER